MDWLRLHAPALGGSSRIAQRQRPLPSVASPLPASIDFCMEWQMNTRSRWEPVMSLKMIALVALSAFAATNASAQAVGTQTWVPNLSGVYRCVHNCQGVRLVHIAQSGRELGVTNGTGQSSTAWINWPGHIWSQSLNEGAVYSPDGFTIQFDGGMVWVLVEPTPAPGSAIFY